MKLDDREPNPTRGDRRLGWWLWGSIATVVITVFAILGWQTLGLGADEESSPTETDAATMAPAQSEAIQSASASDPVEETTPSPRVAPIESISGCPIPSGDRQSRSVEVEVIYWCNSISLSADGSLHPDQHQIKVRLAVTNTSLSSSIDVSIDAPSTVRLLVLADRVDDRWDPPPLTASAGDAPVTVEIGGVAYWAIPPNLPGDVVNSPNSSIAGFASVWDVPPSLIEGGRIGSDVIGTGRLGRGDTSTDLVFEVPGAFGETVDVYGIAIFDVAGGLGAARDWPLIGECRAVDGCMTAENQLAPNLF